MVSLKVQKFEWPFEKNYSCIVKQNWSTHETLPEQKKRKGLTPSVERVMHYDMAALYQGWSHRLLPFDHRQNIHLFTEAYSLIGH